MTNLLCSGEQFNPVSGLQYLRVWWYNPQTETFNCLDPFSGNKTSPLSFHKYAYAHMNPVMGMDPSGNFVMAMVSIGLQTLSSAMGALRLLNGYKAAMSLADIIRAANTIMYNDEVDYIVRLSLRTDLVFSTLNSIATMISGVITSAATGIVVTMAFATLCSAVALTRVYINCNRSHLLLVL